MSTFKVLSLLGIALLSSHLVFAGSECVTEGTKIDDSCKNGYRLFDHENCGTAGVNCALTTEKYQFLYKCDSSPTCDLITTPGYYIQDTSVYSCKDIDGLVKCSIENVPVADACTGKAGKIIKASSGGALSFCQNATTSKAIDTGASFIFNYVEGNVFGIESGHSIFITITPNDSVIQVASGYKFVDKSDCFNTGDCKVITSGDGYLYNCGYGKSLCERVRTVGYYKEGDNYYQCSRKSDAVDVKCSIVDFGAEVTDCSNSNGKLVKIGGSVKFCNGETVKDLVSESFILTSGNYGTDNIFGLDSAKSQKVVITMTSSTIIAEYNLPACTGCLTCLVTANNNGELANNNFCISGSNIYKGASGTDTLENKSTDFDEGIYIFDITNPAAVTKIGNPSEEDLNGKILALYDCGFKVCKQTYGYVHAKDGEYAVTPAGTYSGSYVSTSTCDAAHVGQVKYNSKLYVCAISDVTITSATPTISYAFKAVEGDQHFVITPTVGYDYGLVYAGYNYFDYALLKAQTHVVALAMAHGLALPECDGTPVDTSNACKVNTVEVSYCIKSNKVYKTGTNKCEIIYGETGKSTGIKIFQIKSKTSSTIGSFNSLEDVTDSLDSISLNGQELTPFFVIYDCRDSGCTQTSGFVKYKVSGSSTYNFMNCFMDTYNMDVNNPMVGCIRLNRDADTSNAGCNVLKAAYGAYRYTDFNDEGEALFESCISPMIGINLENYRYVSMKIKKDREGLRFFFNNGYSIFPDISSRDKVMVKMNNYSVVNVISGDIANGYYVNSGSIYSSKEEGQDTLIYCSLDELNNCSVEAVAPGYYTNVSDDKDIYGLIHCSTTDCETVNTINGSYLNAGKETSKNVIVCDDGSCEASEVSDCTGNLGKVYIEGGKSYFCSTTSKTTNYEVSNTKTEEKYIEYNTNDLVRIGTDGSAIHLDPITLPECTTDSIAAEATTGCQIANSVNVNYCINSGVIYASGTSGTNKVCTALPGTSTFELFYFKNDGKSITKIDTPTESASNIFAYQCTYEKDGSNYTNPKCELAKGYILSGTGNRRSLIHCSGWNGFGCTVSAVPTDTTCQGNEEEGKLISATTLCFGDVAYTLPTGTVERTIGVTFNDISTIYGVGRKSVLLTVSADHVLIKTAPSSTEYYFNENYYYTKGTPIVKNNAGTLTATTLASPSAGYALIDSGDSTLRSIIYYNDNTQEYVHADITEVIKTKDLYYIDDSSSKKNIITCHHKKGTTDTVDDGCKSTESTVEDTKFEFYLDATKSSNIITCKGTLSGPICTSSHPSGLTSFVDTNTAGNVISCVYGQCQSAAGVTTAGQAYIDGKDSNQKSIITCTGTGSEKVCESTSLTLRGTESYYYIDASNPRYVILCDNNRSNKCESEYGSLLPGYAYIDTTTAKYVIICDETACNSVDTKASESNIVYYINAADPAKVIKCDNTSCTSVAHDSLENKYNNDATDTNGKRMINCQSGLCISTQAITFCSSTTSSTEYCKYKKTATEEDVIPKDRYCINAADSKIYHSNYDEDTKVKSCEAVTSDILLTTDDKEFFREVEGGKDSSGLGFECTVSGCTPYLSSYFLHKITSDDSEINYLYKCDGVGSCAQENHPSTGYYLNGAVKRFDNEMPIHQKLIEYDEEDATKCTIKNTPTNGNYVDASVKGSLISCYNQDCYRIKPRIGVGIVYIDAGVTPNKNLIICDESNCKSEDWVTGLAEGEVKNFVSGSSRVYCIGGTSGVCTSGSENKSYVLATDPNYSVVCDGRSYCAVRAECRVNTGIHCKDKTYYLVKKDGTDADLLLVNGSDAGYLYYCEANASVKSGISCSQVKNEGYYINIHYNIAYECHLNSGLVCQTFTFDDICTPRTVFLKYGKPAFCIDGDHYLILDSTTKYRLLSDMPTEGSNVVFKTSDSNYTFGLVKVSENSVTFATEYNYEFGEFIYVNPGNASVLQKETCPTNNYDPFGPKLIAEYQCKIDKGFCKKI